MTLKEKYKEYFDIGAAVNVRTVDTHKKLIKEHFSSITCENEMKWGELVSDEGIYDFRDCDKIFNFAKENNIKMRGHTFVWHNQAPEFIFNEKLKEHMQSHMKVMSERYGSYIKCWDAVNEAIEDKSEIFLRKSRWLDIMGEGFVQKAFEEAGKIFPDSKLFYNDYNECDSEKRDKIIKLVRNMKADGVPIGGVGLQCHWNIYHPDFSDIKRAFEMYMELDVDIHVTELDISLFRFEDKTRLEKPTPDLIEKQADMYEKAFKMFREYKNNISSVTLWGIADDETWLSYFPVKDRKNWPLLFDDNHEPKEAFLRIMEF